MSLPEKKRPNAFKKKKIKCVWRGELEGRRQGKHFTQWKLISDE